MKYLSILKYLQTFPDHRIWKAATTPISAAILCLLWRGYLLTFCRTASNRLRKLWIEISNHSRKESRHYCVWVTLLRAFVQAQEWVECTPSQRYGWNNITEVEVGIGWNWSEGEVHTRVFHAYENGWLYLEKRRLGADILIIQCIYLILIA